MRKFATVLAVLVAFAFVVATPAWAADNAGGDTKPNVGQAEGTRVAGKVIKVDDKKITVKVDDKKAAVKEVTFTVDDTTVVVKDGGAAAAADVVKGTKITALVKDGVATRIEIHTKHNSK